MSQKGILFFVKGPKIFYRPNYSIDAIAQQKKSAEITICSKFYIDLYCEPSVTVLIPLRNISAFDPKNQSHHQEFIEPERLH
jgi:hypothetical protein